MIERSALSQSEATAGWNAPSLKRGNISELTELGITVLGDGLGTS